MKIKKIIAHELFDSRGWPTVGCEVILENDVRVYSSVPTGLSRSSYEAYEMRDGGKRLWGKGVQGALSAINNSIAPEFEGKDVNALLFDEALLELDGTPNKAHLGANATLAASMAFYKAQAAAENIELFELIAYIMGSESVSLPFPFFNLINGGLHAKNNLQIQEFLVIPVAASHFRDGLEVGAMVFHELGNILQRKGYSRAVGDEGGYAANFASDYEAFELLYEAIQRVEDEHGLKCVLGIDVAASRFYDPGTYMYKWDGKYLRSEELINKYLALMEQYPLYAIEDGLAEDDWDGWQLMSEKFEDRVQIVADDLCATNINRVLEAFERDCITSVIIKPNQVGTVTEALQAIKLCKEGGLNTIVSHRSGETEDSFIADLAVGSSAGQIKAGGLSGSERLAKYNRLLIIEDELLDSQE